MRVLTDRTAGDEDVEDEEEADTADSVPAPLVPLALVVVRSSDSGKQASDDHEDVGKDGQHGRRGREAGEDAERDEQERSGEQPVNVSCSVSDRWNDNWIEQGSIVKDRTYEHSRPVGKDGHYAGCGLRTWSGPRRYRDQ